MTLVIALGIAFLVSIVLLMPFFVGPGGQLQSSAASQSLPELLEIKRAVVARYIHEEQEFNSGELSSASWKQRRSYLVNRYVDAARRIDFLGAAKKQNN